MQLLHLKLRKCPWKRRKALREEHGGWWEIVSSICGGSWTHEISTTWLPKWNWKNENTNWEARVWGLSQASHVHQVPQAMNVCREGETRCFSGMCSWEGIQTQVDWIHIWVTLNRLREFCMHTHTARKITEEKLMYLMGNEWDGHGESVRSQRKGLKRI